MTRAAPRIIPLPASQMELQRARQTIRAEQASDRDLLDACAALMRHGDWMDHTTASRLRLVIFARNGWRPPPARTTTGRTRATLAAAIALTVALAAGILAQGQWAKNTPAPAALSQEPTR